jgi:hypothetical protein
VSTVLSKLACLVLSVRLQAHRRLSVHVMLSLCMLLLIEKDNEGL